VNLPKFICLLFCSSVWSCSVSAQHELKTDFISVNLVDEIPASDLWKIDFLGELDLEKKFIAKVWKRDSVYNYFTKHLEEPYFVSYIVLSLDHSGKEIYVFAVRAYKKARISQVKINGLGKSEKLAVTVKENDCEVDCLQNQFFVDYKHGALHVEEYD